MQDVVNIISQLGFPIFVAVWMLYKTSKDSEEMRESINELKTAIVTLTDRVSSKGKDNNAD